MTTDQERPFIAPKCHNNHPEQQMMWHNLLGRGLNHWDCENCDNNCGWLPKQATAKETIATTDQELLAKIDAATEKRKRIYGTIGTRSPEVPRVLTDYHNTGISFLLALRAVVELHKPIPTKQTGNDSELRRYICQGCNIGIEPKNWLDLPCPTIQAIEGELG